MGSICLAVGRCFPAWGCCVWVQYGSWLIEEPQSCFTIVLTPVGEQVPCPLAATLTQTAWGSQSIGTGSAWLLHQAKQSKHFLFLPISLQFTIYSPDLRVPWTARTSNQSIQKEINPEYLLEGLDAEAEVLIFWPPDPRSQLTGKGPDADEDWGQEKKGATEDEMVGWHHQLNGHEFEQIPGDGEGQGSLVCCSPWGCK